MTATWTPAAADVLASGRTWMESDAVDQLRATGRLPGMVRVLGMPDLHPGVGSPVGAVFASAGWVYPHLVGGDVGCGMSLTLTDLKRSAAKPDRWARRLESLEGPGGTGDERPEEDHSEDEGPEDERPAAWLAARGAGPPTPHDAALGTIGLGNHFAEVQAVQEVRDAAGAAALGLDPARLVLLVHSGSRGLGEAVLRAHTARRGAAGLADGTAPQADYLAQHDHATAWARANRALIARRFLRAIGAAGRPLLDVAHNLVSPGTVAGQLCWLHRKGATPADGGPVLIAGTRGTLSYVVAPTGDGAANLHTLAHGAGRKWKRSDARGRLEGRYRAQDLTRTALGGHVICGDKALLYEEAPAAYKDVEGVVADLVDAGAATVIASLRPLLTYKTAARPHR